MKDSYSITVTYNAVIAQQKYDGGIHVCKQFWPCRIHIDTKTILYEHLLVLNDDG
jgi:hypothetical protein